MEDLSSYTFEACVYVDGRTWYLVHHLRLNVDAEGWWGLNIFCNNQNVAGGHVARGRDFGKEFQKDGVITCLLCIATAGRAW